MVQCSKTTEHADLRGVSRIVITVALARALDVTACLHSLPVANCSRGGAAPGTTVVNPGIILARWSATTGASAGIATHVATDTGLGTGHGLSTRLPTWGKTGVT